MELQLHAADFDLHKTLNSGQVFHWEPDGGGFYGLIGDLPLYIEQAGERLRLKVAPASSGCGNASSAKTDRPDAAATVRHYFALDHRLNDICGSFPDDPIMNAAAEYCRGLRIIRQPKWECLATFICSSMKQVAHIRQMSRALRERFGEKRELERRTLFTFPTAARLAQSSEKELRKCALGFRAKNLLMTARQVAAGEADLEKWTKLPDTELIDRLCDLPGVGAKVANCVMLFAYERLRAFPIDVWIERVLRQRYFARKRKPTAAKLRAFTINYFGKHGGYAQQYLFHHARTTSRHKSIQSGGTPPHSKTQARNLT
ncbi:MAG TPA: DNA glycosylase [Chthoniobacterales bacterium]|nr:DNA glycosylase [Chthoniobacterales bacterium]